MKKILIILISFCVLVLATNVIYISLSDSTGLEVVNLEDYDSYMEEQGLDADGFTSSQKQSLFEQQARYSGDFVSTEYIAPSTNEILFSRDWSLSGSVDRTIECPISPDVFLFSDGNQYIILAKFTVPYSYNTSDTQLGFIDVGYSNNYRLSFSYSISYVKQGIEYQIQSGQLPFVDGTTYIPIHQNRSRIASLSYPELIYTIYGTAIPTEDNDLMDDLYFGIDLDFYFLKSSDQETILIGFNEFSNTYEHDIYTVTRRSIQYDRSEVECHF
ncbi:MAG: hypothetical protein JXB08_04435 [Bacilli bacterium]|nr:hypothetical protein [Bacilli bacterium]MBN2876359.1 hypothetical protein [Bacilli bacterium]